jgi:hypothetical protein
LSMVVLAHLPVVEQIATLRAQLHIENSKQSTGPTER